jgi:hypothetical protein
VEWRGGGAMEHLFHFGVRLFDEHRAPYLQMQDAQGFAPGD